MRPALRSSVSHSHTKPTPTGRSALQFSRILADRKVGATPFPIACPRTQPGLNRFLVPLLALTPPLFLSSNHVIVTLALPEFTVPPEPLILLLPRVSLISTRTLPRPHPLKTP